MVVFLGFGEKHAVQTDSGRITISNSNDQHKLSLYILRIRIWVKY